MKLYNTSTYRLDTACGKMYISFLKEGDKLHAIQVNLGKSGTCIKKKT